MYQTQSFTRFEFSTLNLQVEETLVFRSTKCEVIVSEKSIMSLAIYDTLYLGGGFSSHGIERQITKENITK